MTSVNIFVRPDAVHVATDGLLSFKREDVHPGRLHKVHFMPAASAVYVARGDIGLALELGVAIDLIGGDLDLKAAALATEYARLRGLCIEQTGDDSRARSMDAFLAGWSVEHGEFCAYLLSGFDRPDMPAGMAHRVIGIVAPPLAGPLSLARDEGDVADIARFVHAEQCANPDHEWRVGGFCQLTSVYRDRIVTRILSP